MVIRRGEDWGEPAAEPADLAWFADDRSAARYAGESGVARMGLLGGDMARTLGAVGEGPSVRFSVDLVRVSWEGDGGRGNVLAMAHAVVRRRRGWTGPIVAVMNAQFMGEWDVAPRGHPNDGRADVLEVHDAMSVGQRWLARRRLPLGTHVPHPSIRVAARDRAEWIFDEDLDLSVDGVSMGRIRRFGYEMWPDAVDVWVRQ